MQRAALLYNPAAGSMRKHARTLPAVVEVLRSHGLEVMVVATQAPGTAAEQARRAADSSELVFACGGDGTVHEVLQGLALNKEVTLGILPFGSANVLARHLSLSLDPVRAALQQIGRQRALVPLGQVTYQSSVGVQSRFFASVAGAGADGLLVYKELSKSKKRFGRSAYYLRAAQLCVTHPFVPFQVESMLDDGSSASIQAVSLISSRVGNLGGAFQTLVRRGSVQHTNLAFTAVRPPAPGLCWHGLLLVGPAWAATTGGGSTSPLRKSIVVRASEA